MNVKENYLSRNSDADMMPRPMSSPGGSSRVQEQHDSAWPSSRQRAVHAASTSMERAPSVAPSSPGLNRRTLAHNASDVSLRTLGSYARFDPTTYVDPAFFEPNAEPKRPPRDAPTRPASSASGLSYVSEKR